MSKKREIEFFVLDILLSVDRIKRFSKKYANPKDFFEDEETYAAALRELEIMGEAMRHVLKAEKYKDIIQLKWRIIADFRNVVIHEYFGLEMDTLEEVMYRHIYIFESEFLEFVKKIEMNSLLLEAINIAKLEMRVLNRKKSLLYLAEIEKLLSNK